MSRLGSMDSEMEMGRVEGVQHMAGTPLRCAVVGKFGWGECVLRWDSVCDCGGLRIAVMAVLATRDIASWAHCSASRCETGQDAWRWIRLHHAVS